MSILRTVNFDLDSNPGGLVVAGDVAKGVLEVQVKDGDEGEYEDEHEGCESA